ncbi:DUF6527 family protein [Coleofasciculus sp.]|uniref:DUF6527 family protein n=1 Tax=Coleofasciculus sp. TaxID=3100458 RepID=UPI0039FB5A34
MFLRSLVRHILLSLRLIKQPELIGRIISSHPTPEEIAPSEIVIVGDEKYRKWACFRCPGGCGEVILLSLNTSRRPSWKVVLDWLKRPTVYPSVRQLNECKCHFWVRKGQIEWVDSPL